MYGTLAGGLAGGDWVSCRGRVFGNVYTALWCVDPVSLRPIVGRSSNFQYRVGDHEACGANGLGRASVTFVTGTDGGYRQTACLEKIGSASADGTQVPDDDGSVTDASGALWTLDDQPLAGTSYVAILRNGAMVADAYGSAIRWVNQALYVRGDDDQWYRWTGVWFEWASWERP